MTRDDIIKAAERFADELDFAYGKGGGRAELIRSLIALVPKEGEVVVPIDIVEREVKKQMGKCCDNCNCQALKSVQKAMLKAAKDGQK